MSKRDNFEMNHEVTEEGIAQILGRSSFSEPEPVGPPCKHSSDGFIYNWDDREKPAPVMLLLMCTKCHEQYEVPNDGYTIEIP